MKKSVLIFTLLLVGCYDLPQPNYTKPTGVAPSQYQALYEGCIKRQAEVLDDGTSPADVIGNSIADACNQEYIAAMMQIVSADNQAVQNQFYRTLTLDRALAASGPTKYVLSRRAYLKAHPKK